MHILHLLPIHYARGWASISVCFPSVKQFLKSVSQPGEESREEEEKWVMGLLQDPTGSLGSGASWLPQAAPGWVWWAADAIYVKLRPLRWGQDTEAAVVVLGKLCGVKGQWRKPELSFCQDVPLQKRQLQHLPHPPHLPASRVAACAKELTWVLPAPDGRSCNLGSQIIKNKEWENGLWDTGAAQREEKKKEFENYWIIFYGSIILWSDLASLSNFGSKDGKGTSLSHPGVWSLIN